MKGQDTLDLAKRFEAMVFDWDGTAVPDRTTDASEIRRLVEALCAAGMDLYVVSGTHAGNIDGQLRARPHGPGRLHLCLNRGSEVFAVDVDGVRLVDRREATVQEDAQLTAAAELTVRRLAERGLRAAIVSLRLNRRKIDIIPEPEWIDPPKARIGELLDAVMQRLAQYGFRDLNEIVAFAAHAAVEAGLRSPRVTSDVKHVEIGLTDKSDSALWISQHLRARGISAGQVLLGGDEFGPLGGLAGSDSLMLIPELGDATAVSVGVEPAGVPSGVLQLEGGPSRFVAILDDQLRRREVGEVPIIDHDPAWTVTFDGAHPELERVHEALLTLADGSIGSSGSPIGRHEAATPGVYASGFYSGTGPTTELVACPTWTTLPLELDAETSLERTLDLRTGVLHQHLHIGEQTVDALGFSSAHTPGVAVLRATGSDLCVQGTPLDPPANGVSAEGSSEGFTWMTVAGATGELTSVAVDRERPNGLDRVAVYAPGGLPEARRAFEKAGHKCFDELLIDHRLRWADRWRDADVVIGSDPDLQRAVRFALFHLMSQVPDFGEAAVGARGTTGPAYRGHVFWDADVFVLPFLAATHPASARAMLEYRIRRLPAAMHEARRRGRTGARFPWESAAEGIDVTPTAARDLAGRVVPIRTGDAEEHIVADIAWAADCYVRWSQDDAFARGPGRALWIETARYWASRTRRNAGRSHIFGVIGPDEYHDPVDDNAFTNVMARWNLRRAAAAAGEDVAPDEVRGWLALADDLVDGYDTTTGLYEQFAGFYDLEPLVIADVASKRPVVADLLLGRDRVATSQVIKQADVLMLHFLGVDDRDSLRPNLEYYEPRTAHGSSLSPGVHAALFAMDGRPDDGLPWLDLAAHIDLDDLSGSTAGGLHLAAMGSLWQAIAFGYAGLRPEGNVLHVRPRLPPAWSQLEINVRFGPSRVRVGIDGTGATVSSDPAIDVEVHE